MIRQPGLLLVMALLFLACSPVLSAQNSDTFATVFSKTTVEPDGLLAECSTDVSGLALGLYKMVRAECSVTKDNTKLIDADFDCHSAPFFPFVSFSAPPLNADCTRHFTIPIVGGSTYRTDGTHKIYLAPNVFGLGTPPTDPCDFRNVFLQGSPFVDYEGFCFFDGTTFPPGFIFDPNPPFQAFFKVFGVTFDATATTTIDPAEVTLGPKEKQKFTSKPATNTVKWSLDPPQIGTIDQAGNYLAPDVITSEQTVTVNACSTTHPSDCGHATVTLVPLSVIIRENNPQKFLEVLPFEIVTFHTLVTPPTASKTVIFELIPDPSDAGVLEQQDFTSAAFTAGENTGPHTATVKACSAVDDMQCDDLTVFIPFVTITVNADHNPLTASAGAEAKLTATVTGTARNSIQWFHDPSAPGTFTETGSIEQYQVPSPVINLPAEIKFMACLAQTVHVCSPYTLTLRPPVVPAVGPATWSAGQSTSITITGTGFGAQPAVQINDPRIVFTQTSFTSSPTSSTIQGTVSVPLLLDGETALLTVTDTSTVPPIQATLPIPILPVSLSVTVAPASATLQETQSQIFTPNISCLTATGAVCVIPQPVSWSINPSVGSIDQIGIYTAPANVATQQTVTVNACITIGSSRCGSATVTLVPVPKVSVSPAALDFGGQLLGTTSAAGTIVLSNIGSLPVVINSITPTGDFGRSHNCPPSLAVNTSCSISITFTPTVAGPRTGTLTITDNAFHSPQTASLSGTGLPLVPVLTGITPSTVTTGSSGFTLIATGSSFASNAVVQVNGSARQTRFINLLQLQATILASDLTGSQPLNITVLNPAPSGAVSTALSLTLTSTPIPLISNLTPPRVIECDPALSPTPCPSFKLIVNGSFFPSNARVQIDGADCVTTFISANQLTATILPANLTRSRFASIKVFNPTSGQLGANDAPLAVFRYGDLAFDNGVSANDLTVMANVLAGNFTPLDSTPGDVLLDGKINITDLNTLANFLAGNINHLPIIPDQTAILFNAGAPVNLSPPTFAGQMVGTTSEPLSLKLTNGPTPLSISVNVTPIGEFIQTNDCGLSLAANASCTINVTFSPTLAGSRMATLTVTNNAGNSPQTANLSGTGIGSAAAPTAAPTAATTAALSSSLGITVGPVTLAFPSQTVGTNSAFQRIRLINTGPTALSISGINIAPSGEFTESGNCGTSLAAGTSCNIDVTFSPATSGTRTATLTVTDNASNSPQTASLTGTGAP